MHDKLWAGCENLCFQSKAALSFFSLTRLDDTCQIMKKMRLFPFPKVMEVNRYINQKTNGRVNLWTE